MSKVFDDIKQGLKQAIAYENGELSDVKITIILRKLHFFYEISLQDSL